MTVCERCHDLGYTVDSEYDTHPCPCVDQEEKVDRRRYAWSPMVTLPDMLSPTRYVIAGAAGVVSEGCVSAENAAWAAMWAQALTTLSFLPDGCNENATKTGADATGAQRV